MSQHSSLKGDSVGNRHRNVLKRHERLKVLLGVDDGKERSSVYKLPKMKLIKLKVKKEKSAKEEAAAAEGATAPTPGTPQAQAAPSAQKAGASAQKPAAQAQKPRAAEKPKGKEK